MKTIYKFAFILLIRLFCISENIAQAGLFPFMSNEITGNCEDTCNNMFTITYRYFGEDTFINSRSIGNTTYVEVDDSTTIMHSYFNHADWFHDSIIFQKTSPKLYHNFYIKVRNIYGVVKKHFFIREECGQIFMHSYSPDSLQNFEQLLFYYDARPNIDEWEVKGFWYGTMMVAKLTEKKNYAILNDTLYTFYFSEKIHDDASVTIYVSKRYGIVGFRETCSYYPHVICETWYSPY